MAALTKIVSVLLAAGTVLSFGGAWHYMLDNLSSFKVHFAMAFLACTLVFAFTRSYIWLAISGLGLVANAAAIVPWYLSTPNGAGGDDVARFRVMSSNVSPRNEHPQRLAELVTVERPDVIGLIEVTPGFLDGLGNAFDQYPFRYEAPHATYWGLALYSRLPLSDATVTRFDDDLPPVLEATVRVGEAELDLFLTHPLPPMSADLARRRNSQLDWLAEMVSRASVPVVVLGDLNTAMWSPHYRDFVRKSGLVNARQSHGVAGTWPATRILGVPIDHIFHRETIRSERFRVLSNIGSDHLPIMADILVPSGSVDDQSNILSESTVEHLKSRQWGD